MSVCSKRCNNSEASNTNTHCIYVLGPSPVHMARLNHQAYLTIKTSFDSAHDCSIMLFSPPKWPINTLGLEKHLLTFMWCFTFKKILSQCMFDPPVLLQLHKHNHNYINHTKKKPHELWKPPSLYILLVFIFHTHEVITDVNPKSPGLITDSF